MVSDQFGIPDMSILKFAEMNKIVLLDIPLIVFFYYLDVMIELIDFITLISEIHWNIFSTFLWIRNEAVNLIHNVCLYVFYSVHVIHRLSLAFFKSISNANILFRLFCTFQWGLYFYQMIGLVSFYLDRRLLFLL